MYVVCGGSSTIRLYNTDTFSPLDVVINVYGMRRSCDIVVCRDDRQLYVADIDCIWRVSVDSHTYVMWLTIQSMTGTFNVMSLSLTSRRLLVTSLVTPYTSLVTSYRPHDLRQYHTTDRQLLRVVKLPGYVNHVYHGVETTRGTFIIGHNGTSQNMSQDAVSELFRLCRLVKYCIIS